VHVTQLALGESPGELPLRAPEDDVGDTGRRSLFGAGQILEKVPVAVFDQLVSAGVVDLSLGLHAVKIDVEGNELAVLRGMRQSLQTYRPRIVLVETVESNLAAVGSSVAEIHTFMRSLGYESSSPVGSLNSAYVPVAEPDSV
jgi:hypothetical protein